jgi:FkbM family methyltransferase
MSTLPGSQTPRRVRIAGHEIIVTDDKPTFWDKAEAGAWESETLAAIAGLCRPGVAFLDIGAWVGPTVLYAAACGATVTAVEADPRALELLRGNVEANPGLSARITILPGAASSRPGSIRIAAPRKPGDSMTSVLVTDSPHVFEVPALLPADLLAAVTPDRSGLVVKIDIEGAEYDLVPALVRALPEDTRALLVAFHPGLLAKAGQSLAEIAAATDACFEALAGYAPEIVDGGDDGQVPAETARKRNVTVRFLKRPA